DFVYIDDLVDGIMQGITRFDALKNDVFNLGSGKGAKLVDVAKMLKNIIRSQSKIKIEKPRPGEMLRYIANITKARKVLKYKPKVTLQEGLKRSVAWYSENPVEF